jgi:hypothetical protein
MSGRSWDDATPDEIRDARIQQLEEGLQRLCDCVGWALEQTAQRPGSPVRPEDALKEDWSK